MLGFKLDARPAEDVIDLARATESAGFDQLWVCEDLGLAGGIAQSAAALAVTDRLEVGLGIAPAAVRNPAYLAMELSAVSRLSHGRFHAGIGHGMPNWLTQVGQHPRSLMTCLKEVSESVSRLMDGGAVTYHGEQVHLTNVEIAHPPATPRPLSLGVRGPRGIALAAELGLGVILAEGSTPEYVADVRRQLGPEADITVFVWSNIDPDDARAGSDALAEKVSEAVRKPYLAAQLGDLAGAECSLDAIRRVTVSGDASTCREAITRLTGAGADSVVLQPILGTEERQLDLFGRLLIA
ncbi:MAG: LLM class flavin-dependent oxidoreductase [Mycobacterium kyogaense]|uniref:LLM class flavin-dependent oxidoreductase n=1 Tax=Mycobacterium kyogaense TaxID=2212479 RepID=UPI002FF84AAB